jgi:hypothetical protein
MRGSPIRAGGPILACWAALALAAPTAPAAEPASLKLVQTIPP